MLRESVLGVNEPTHKLKQQQPQNRFPCPIRATFNFTNFFRKIDCKSNTNKQTNPGQNENVNLNGFGQSGQYSEEKSYSTQRYESKIPLKLVMDPRGVVQDVHSQGITYDHTSGMLSPDKCAELVSALHTDAPKGKGSYSLLHNQIQIDQSVLMELVFVYVQVPSSLPSDVSDRKNGLLTKQHDRLAIQPPLRTQPDQHKSTTLINTIKQATNRLIIR